MTRRTGRSIATLALGLSIFVAASAGPALAGPFSDMAGNWAGSGTLSRKSAPNERLRCKAGYTVAHAGDQVNLRITCASDSFKFDLTGYIDHAAGSLSGHWSEPNYNSSGELDGKFNDGKITAHVVGNTFSAHISVLTQGPKQTVTIEPQETDVTRVALVFQKQ